MKTYIKIFCAIFVLCWNASSQTAEGGIRLYEMEDRRGRKITWTTNLETLKRYFLWDPKEKCPLSVSEAYKNSEKWFNKNGYAGVQIISIKLRRGGIEEGRAPWWYVIEAANPPLDSIACVVLLSGDVVSPKFPDREDK